MKPTKYILFIFLVLILQSCRSKTELHQVFDESGNLVEEYTRNIEDFSKEGLYTRFYEDGKTPAEQATYVRDTLDGWKIFFNENGDTSSVSKIEKGILHGPHREFHPNGKVSQAYHHVNGEIIGIFKEYHESGALKGEITFSGNNENGHFVEFHENGKKAWEGTNKDGKEHGEVLKYDENGELIRKLNCVVGRCETIWKKEGIKD